MPRAREICFQHWGKKCFGCGAGIGIEVHHIDGNSSNDDPQNLMPLCGTCHNLVTAGTLQINPNTREITVNLLGLFNVGPIVSYPPNQVQVQLLKFKKQVKTWEEEEGQPFLLLQDGVNTAYFIECHIQAQHLAPLLYEGTVLNPDDFEDPDAEEYKLNREILELHAVFRRMQEDAERGRPFSDIIVEFNEDYVPDQPLKIIAGQHRARAIQDAIQANKEVERLHGTKVYFSLTKEQRGEISLMSNTNIAIAKQLVDRFGELYIGPESRQWCQEVGLLESGKDFADRLAGAERFTVQILRALAINFFHGKSFEGDIDETLHEGVYIPHSGSLLPDPEYKKILEENRAIWRDPAIAEMGRMFALLNTSQVEACSTASDDHRELRRIGFKYKTFTPAIATAWAYVSGLLQSEPQRLGRHYSLPNMYDKTKSPDPLNAKEMSTTRHETVDEQTYRGLGTRQSPRDAQRIVELFLLQSKPDFSGTITRELLKAAVAQQLEKLQRKQREEFEKQAREAAVHIHRNTVT